MKAKIIALFLFILVFPSLYSQITLVLQNDSTSGMDTDINYYYPDKNWGDLHRFRTEAWTYFGDLSIMRCLIYFDLSSIPINSHIASAVLSLYHDNDLEHSTLSGSNACWLQRVTSPWDEYSASWNSQPSTTTVNQVAIEASETTDQDYPHIDVTNLIQDMVDIPDSSYGFLLKLQTEEIYRRLSFASRENIDPAKRPKLTIDYYDCIATFYDTIRVTISDTLKITVTDTLIINVTLTDIDLNDVYSKIKIYPNPTHDIVFIDVSDHANLTNYKIKIINTLSETIFISAIDQQIFEISINQFGAKGLYFIQLFDESDNILDIRKIILQ